MNKARLLVRTEATNPFGDFSLGFFCPGDPGVTSAPKATCIASDAEYGWVPAAVSAAILE